MGVTVVYDDFLDMMLDYRNDGDDADSMVDTVWSICDSGIFKSNSLVKRS
jgi:hypothetical protein